MAVEGTSGTAVSEQFDYFWQRQGEWVEEPNQRRGGESGVQRVCDETGHLLYAKRQIGHIYRSLLHPFGRPTVLREFDALHSFEQLGVRVPHIVYCGVERDAEHQWRALLVSEALELGQDQVVSITPTTVTVTDFHGNLAEGRRYSVDWDASAAEKGGFRSFMDKEIHDQPQAITDTLLGRTDLQGRLQLDDLRIDESVLRAVDKIIVIACGTAAYAGHVAKYAIEHWCRIPVEVELAHEFRYRDPIVNEKTLVVAVSQSGETMDTLMAVRHAREQGAKVLSIVNTHGSTIPRESDAVLYTHAGPEVAVASTKAFLSQITAAYLLGLYLAQLRGNKFPDEIREVLADLREMPAKIQEVIDRADHVRDVAVSMADTTSVLFLGRHVGYPVAMEGALKLKEISYIHAEAYPAGELKHGPLALVDNDMPVVTVAPNNELLEKLKSNLQEVRARGGELIVFADEQSAMSNGEGTHVINMPHIHDVLAPILYTIPLQLLSYYVAVLKGTDVDQPRNLAKSVTVE